MIAIARNTPTLGENTCKHASIQT